MGNSTIVVHIHKQGTAGTFTNHDEIRGHLLVTVGSSLSLHHIVVKLEGIASTELTVPKTPTTKPLASGQYDAKDVKRVTETHKVLYQTTIVFPPPSLRAAGGLREFTLAPGEYTYPFTFRIPFQSRCDTSLKPSLGKGSGLNPPKHLSTQLPPSFTAMGAGALVRYFVKATAKRSSLLRTNLRSLELFLFLPLHHPDPQLAPSRVFVRQPVKFRNMLPAIVEVKPFTDRLGRVHTTAPAPAPRPGFFRSLFFTEPVPAPSESSRLMVKTTDVPFYVELRMEHPATLVPGNEPTFSLHLISPLPPTTYRLSTGATSGLGAVYVMGVVVELMVSTVVRADGHKAHRHSVERLLSFSGVHAVDLSEAKESTARHHRTGAVLYELQLPQRLLKGDAVPNHTPPSFRTCNISRAYRLRVKCRVGSAPDREHTQRVELCTDVHIASGLSMSMAMLQRVKPSEPSDLRPQPLRGLSVAVLFAEYTDTGATPGGNGTKDDSEEGSNVWVTSEPSETLTLPSYDDVLWQDTAQSDSDHLRARQRYQEHQHYTM